MLALQWAVGWPHLIEHARTVAAGVLVPAAYLCAVDRLAIGEGIWVIGDRYSLGVDPFGLPVEEAVFFVVTTLFVVQGLLLWRWVWRSGAESPGRRRGRDGRRARGG